MTGSGPGDTQEMPTHLAAFQVTGSRGEKTHKYKEEWNYSDSGGVAMSQPAIRGEAKLNAYLIYVKVNSSRTKGFNVEKETIKILE